MTKNVVFVEAHGDLHVPNGIITGPYTKPFRWGQVVQNGATGVVLDTEEPQGHLVAFELPHGLTVTDRFAPTFYKVIPG